MKALVVCLSVFLFLCGGTVLMTVNSAGKDDEAMWTSTTYVVLSAATLNGTYESIGHDRNYFDLSIDTEYEYGTLTRIGCP